MRASTAAHLGDALAGDGDVRAAWQVDAAAALVEVTDGGGPTRPAPATPSVTAHGGRGLNIITALADDWGVRRHGLRLDARGRGEFGAASARPSAGPGGSGERAGATAAP
ncbi:hypothetical protein SVIOM342S_05826 [Streptomyces violaceorubidus]